MKKFFISIALILSSGTFITSTTQSCQAVATSSVGIAVIKQMLLAGINKGLDVFSNKDAFLQNDLINAALPQDLVKINNLLQNISPSLVTKEKDYIAQTAAYTVDISRPILTNAVNSLTSEDIARVAQGTSATQILKEKTQNALIEAITPKVDEKLNSFGIVKSINTALSGNNLLGQILGNGNSTSASGGLSKLASEQMVSGLFGIVQQHEQQNKNSILNVLGGKK
jgi:hypothetical protein